MSVNTRVRVCVCLCASGGNMGGLGRGLDHFQADNSVPNYIVTMLCTGSQNLTHLVTGHLYPLLSPHFSYSPGPWSLPVNSLLLQVWLFRISYIRAIIQCLPFCVCLKVLQGPACCQKWQNLSLEQQNSIPCMDITPCSFI